MSCTEYHQLPYSEKFCEHKFLQMNTKKLILQFLFCDEVTMFDHTLYNFTHENGDAPRQLRVYFNIEMIVRRYLAYQSMWVAVSKNCHAKGSKLTGPKDLSFAVAVMAKIFCGLLDACTTRWVNLLSSYWIHSSKMIHQASSTHWD